MHVADLNEWQRSLQVKHLFQKTAAFLSVRLLLEPHGSGFIHTRITSGRRYDRPLAYPMPVANAATPQGKFDALRMSAIRLIHPSRALAAAPFTHCLYCLLPRCYTMPAGSASVSQFF